MASCSEDNILVIDSTTTLAVLSCATHILNVPLVQELRHATSLRSLFATTPANFGALNEGRTEAGTREVIENTELQLNVNASQELRVARTWA